MMFCHPDMKDGKELQLIQASATLQLSRGIFDGCNLFSVLACLKLMLIVRLGIISPF